MLFAGRRGGKGGQGAGTEKQEGEESVREAGEERAGVSIPKVVEAGKSKNIFL